MSYQVISASPVGLGLVVALEALLIQAVAVFDVDNVS